MSEAKFTKEKWEVANGLLVGEQVLFIHAYPKQVICRLTKQVDSTPLTDEDVANAHLIAAAPEMYTKLDYILSVINSGLYEIDLADSISIMGDEIDRLLAKARGEG